MRQSRRKTASEVICQNFNVIPQTIFQDFRCVLKKSFSFFGRLYVGQEHVLFFSNMFGIVKKCIIIIESIVKIIDSSPHTLLITTSQTEYHFTSFRNNNAQIMIYALWKKERIAPEVLLGAKQEDEEEKNSANDSTVQANFFTPDSIDAEKQKISQYSLPCSLEQYYIFFLADNACVYSKQMHFEKTQAQRINVTLWRKDPQLKAQVRQCSAIVKVKGVPFKSKAPLSQVYVLRRNAEQLTLQIVTQMYEVPFSSYFTCQQFVRVSKDGETKCKVVSQAVIVFNKHCYLKGTILSRSLNELREDYQKWIANVKEKMENIKKEEELAKMKISKIPQKIEFEDQRITQVKEDKQTVDNTSPELDNILLRLALLTKKVQVMESMLKILILLCTLLLLISISNILH